MTTTKLAYVEDMQSKIINILHYEITVDIKNEHSTTVASNKYACMGYTYTVFSSIFVFLNLWYTFGGRKRLFTYIHDEWVKNDAIKYMHFPLK